MRYNQLRQGQWGCQALSVLHFQAAEYKEFETQDGLRVWKYVQHLGRARRSPRLAEQDAVAFADQMGVEYYEGIRQWTPIAEEHDCQMVEAFGPNQEWPPGAPIYR